MPRVASNRVGIDLDCGGSTPISAASTAPRSCDNVPNASIDKPSHDLETDSARAKRQKELLRKKKAERRAHARQRAEQARLQQQEQQQQQQQQQGVPSSEVNIGNSDEHTRDVAFTSQPGEDSPTISKTDPSCLNNGILVQHDEVVTPVRLSDQNFETSADITCTNNVSQEHPSASFESSPQSHTQNAGAALINEPAIVCLTSTATDSVDTLLKEVPVHSQESLSGLNQHSSTQLKPPPTDNSKLTSTQLTTSLEGASGSNTEAASDLIATGPKSKHRRKKKKKKMSARSSAQEAAMTIQHALRKNLLQCKSLVRHSSKVFVDELTPHTPPYNNISSVDDHHMDALTNSHNDHASMECLLPCITSEAIASNKMQSTSDSRSNDSPSAARSLQLPQLKLSARGRDETLFDMTPSCGDIAENSHATLRDDQTEAPALSSHERSTRELMPRTSSIDNMNAEPAPPTLPDTSTHDLDQSPLQSQEQETQEHEESSRSRSKTISSRRSTPRSRSPSRSHSSSCLCSSLSSRRSSVSTSSSCSCRSSLSPSENEDEGDLHRHRSHVQKHRSKHQCDSTEHTGVVDLEAMAVRIQARMRGIFGRERARVQREELDIQLRAEALKELEEDASVAIQSRARGFLARRRLGSEGIAAEQKKDKTAREDIPHSSMAPTLPLVVTRVDTETASANSNLVGDGQVTNNEDPSEKVDAWPEELNLEALDDWEELNEQATISGERVTRARFLSRGQLRVFCGTWNMHAKKPADDTLQLWIRRNKYHIAAIGTEECTHSIAKSVVFTSKKSWEKQLRDALGDEYTLVASHALTAIHLAVFVHESALPLLSHVQSDAVATGIANQLGNKGGVGISLCIGSTSFLFVNCHFDAHQRNVDKRNANFHRINQELKLFPPADPLGSAIASSFSNARMSLPVTALADPGSQSSSSKARRSVASSVTKVHASVSIATSAAAMRRVPAADRFDRVFWFGDLNYRVNGTRRMVDLLLLHDHHAVLRFNDQLSAELAGGRVFPHFSEGPLHFRPTYKFDKLSAVYDSSAKQRIPSWTDRVLFRSNGRAADIKVLSYRSHMSFQSSDHRPVGAVFQVAFLPLTGALGATAAPSQTLQSPPSDTEKQQQQQQQQQQYQPPPLRGSVGGNHSEFGRVVARGYRASQSKSEVCTLM